MKRQSRTNFLEKTAYQIKNSRGAFIFFMNKLATNGEKGLSITVPSFLSNNRKVHEWKKFFHLKFFETSKEIRISPVCRNILFTLSLSTFAYCWRTHNKKSYMLVLQNAVDGFETCVRRVAIWYFQNSYIQGVEIGKNTQFSNNW